MFIAVFLHELSHSLLVWYGRGACNSPQFGGIKGEGGNYVETAFFGGVTHAEFDSNQDPMDPLEIGIQKDGVFYALGESHSSFATLANTNIGNR